MNEDSDAQSETSNNDINLLAMQMQLHQFQPYVSLSELWTIWSLVDSMCYDLNGRDDQGIPPIIYAAKRGSIILLRLLLNYHADINALSEIRETAVMAACRKQKIGAVKFLIKRGARLDLCDKSQFSALRWAASHGNVSLVRLLLHNNVSVQLDCYTPNSALEIAMSSSTKAHAKIVLLLQRQLVFERRKLLCAVVQKKEQDEINLIKKHRRKMKKLKRQAEAGSNANEPTEQPVIAAVERSPFTLPIALSLKRRKPQIATPESQSAGDLSTSRHRDVGAVNASDIKRLEHSNSIRNLLESQLVAPPPMVWTKVAHGTWRQVEARPRASLNATASGVPDAIEVISPTNYHQEQVTAQEIFASESKWQAFMNDGKRRSRVFCCDDSDTSWKLENVE